MKPRLLQQQFQCALLIFAVSVTARVVAETTLPTVSPAEKKDLFDGKSLSGWTAVSKDTNSESIWSVTNGVIHCLGKPNGYLRTEQAYRDYQLHVEWRWPDGPGNSGAFVHLNPPDVVWPLCFEAQLQANNAGELRFNGGSSSKALASDKIASLPRRQPASEKPIGEWNACDIVCRGDTIAIRINGVLQNELTGASANSGAIALQAEGKPVEFRHISIEPLPKPPGS